MHVLELIATIDAGDRTEGDPLAILSDEVKRLRSALEDIATHPSDSAAFLRHKAERALR